LLPFKNGDSGPASWQTLILILGAAVLIVIRNVMGLSAPAAAGIFCGALTNTPALAAAVEAAKNLSANLPPETRELYAAARL
jgi:uncharacterized transporter YbjL